MGWDVIGQQSYQRGVWTESRFGGGALKAWQHVAGKRGQQEEGPIHGDLNRI